MSYVLHPAKKDSIILLTLALLVSFSSTLLTITFKIEGWSTTIFQERVPDLEV